MLRTLSPYPADYDQCLDQAIEEKTNRTLPRLQPISDRNRRALGQAELIYLVFPNWSYTLPRSLASFFADNAIDGKTIAPLCVHGTGGLARTIADMRRMLPHSRILNPLSLEREEVLAAQAEILRWARHSAS